MSFNRCSRPGPSGRARRTPVVRAVPAFTALIVMTAAIAVMAMAAATGMGRVAWAAEATRTVPPLPANAIGGDETFQPHSGQPGKDVIWVPTPDEIVEALLEMTGVKPGEVHFDLGSGDGKIVIAAAKRGARSTGVEFNPDMVKLSRRNAERAGVADRATFVEGDIFETDFSNADVVTLYLLPRLNLKLLPKLLKELKPGTRIVSHAFDMGDWKPDRTIRVDGRDVHFWTIPAPGTPAYRAAMAAAKGD